MTRLVLVALVVLGGCGKLLGIADLSGPAAPGDAAPADASPDLPLEPDAAFDAPPGSVVVSGTVQIIDGGGSLCRGCAIELFAGASQQSGMTDGNGQFAFTVPLGGQAPQLSLYLRDMPAFNAVGSRTHFARPLQADRVVAITVYGKSEIDRLSSLAGEPQESDRGLVVVKVRDVDGAEAADVMVGVIASPTGRLHYGDGASDPLPAGGRTETNIDGVAYVFGAEKGPHTVTGVKPGFVFESSPIQVDPDGVTFVELVALPTP